MLPNIPVDLFPYFSVKKLGSCVDIGRENLVLFEGYPYFPMIGVLCYACNTPDYFCIGVCLPSMLDCTAYPSLKA
jgi:hypothetical protein